MGIRRRMMFKGLRAPGGGGGGGEMVGGTVGAAGPAATAVPHLLQNFVSGFRVAPQELQNAMHHLVGARCEESTARVYRRRAGNGEIIIPEYRSRLLSESIDQQLPGCARRTAGAAVP